MNRDYFETLITLGVFDNNIKNYDEFNDVCDLKCDILELLRYILNDNMTKKYSYLILIFIYQFVRAFGYDYIVYLDKVKDIEKRLNCVNFKVNLLYQVRDVYGTSWLSKEKKLEIFKLFDINRYKCVKLNNTLLKLDYRYKIDVIDTKIRDKIFDTVDGLIIKNGKISEMNYGSDLDKCIEKIIERGFDGIIPGNYSEFLYTFTKVLCTLNIN